MYGTQYPITLPCMFFSSVHETFTKIDDMLNNKSNLNKPQGTDVISSMFSYHNETELETKNEKISRDSLNIWIGD